MELFPDGVVPPMLPYAARADKIDHLKEFDLQFLNRNDQLVHFWKLMSKKNERKGKPVLISTGQMFGIGKTTFGKNVLNFNNRRISDLFEESIKREGKEFGAQLDKVRAARTVCITMPDSSGLATNIDSLLSLSVFVETLVQCFGVNKKKASDCWDNNPKMKCMGTCVETLLELTHPTPLFFHFDEFGAIEGYPDKLFPFTQVKESEELSNNQRKMGKIYDAWNELQSSLLNENVFIYATGKSPSISLIGKGLFPFMSSPSAVANILLPPLSTNDIKLLILQRSREDDNLHIWQAIKANETELDECTAFIVRMTGGVPRLTLATISAMRVTADQYPQHACLQWHTMGSNDAIFQSFLTAVTDLWLFKADSNMLMRAVVDDNFQIAFMRAIFDVPMHAELIVASTGMIPEQLADKYGFYIRAVPEKPAFVNFLLPELWWHRLRSFSQLKILHYDDHKGYSSSEIFERITQMCIEARLRLNAPSSVAEWLPCTVGSSIGSKALPSDISIKEVNADAKYMKPDQIEEEGEEDRDGERNTTKKEMVVPKDYFSRYFDSSSVNINKQIVMLVPKDKAYFVDRCLIFPSSVDRPQPLIGFQMKLYKSTELSLTTLNTKIQKFTGIFNASRLGFDASSPVSALFVMSCTGRGLEALRGRVLNASNTDGVVIPSGMEVIVLSQEQIKHQLLNRFSYSSLLDLKTTSTEEAD